MDQFFNYEIEPVNETLCIDMKSFMRRLSVLSVNLTL